MSDETDKKEPAAKADLGSKASAEAKADTEVDASASKQTEKAADTSASEAKVGDDKPLVLERAHAREAPVPPGPDHPHVLPDPTRDGEEPELPPPDEDAHESRVAPWWDAGGKFTSAAYWGSLLVMVAALFRSKTLPFVDYPQHLALAATLKRMFTGAASERALFDTNLVSFNSLFHLLVALFNFVVPIDAAGKLALALYVFCLGYAGLALMRATGRPRVRAFFVLPIVFGYTIAWGFVNFSLGAAIQLVVLARTLTRLADHPDNAPQTSRQRLRYDGITIVLATLGAYSHLLASALVYMLMLVAIVAHVQSGKRDLGSRLGQAVRVGLPLLPAIAYSYGVYRRQMAQSFQNFEYAYGEGNDNFAMVKLKGFGELATGLRADRLDEKLLLFALGLLLISAVMRDVRDDEETSPTLRWMWVTATLAFFVIPHVFWATNFVYERITFFIVITAAIWAPRAIARVEDALRIMYVFVGLVIALSFWAWMGEVARETADFDAVIDLAPKGRRVTGLVWDPWLATTGKSQKFHVIASLLHSPAYYVARNGGEVAFSFTRTMSLPVHYRKETMPPDPPPNFEWNPSDYKPNSPWAKYFDVVLMKTMNDDGVDPRESVWHRHANEVDVVAHRGKWWVFETKRVTEDPPPTWEHDPGFLPGPPDDDGNAP